ncbi:hypothetical protein J2847_005867 [Azospirillum agricola]|uniref:hypothetical protein n=1 Tax=Azospirillum agricola TaxID=1720247 RepID=UPI001AEA829B|nr:hypothetical protein [Azospirillum agricola]MBP2232538.1 hypothetical protein [Azospirillum agricola]
MASRNLPRYTPPGAVKVTDKQSDAVAYIYERNGRLMAIGYHGKAGKPDYHFSFSSAARREKCVVMYFESRRKTLAAAQKRRDERRQYQNDYKVGDILNTCWGYEQTNVEYFEVVEVRGAMVVLRQVAKVRKSTGWCQELTAPQPGEYVGEPIRRKAQANGIKISDCQWATRTDFTEVGSMRIYRGHHESSYA